MNIFQTGQMVFRSLWLNKIRFAQVVLGMVVGVAAVVSLYFVKKIPGVE